MFIDPPSTDTVLARAQALYFRAIKYHAGWSLKIQYYGKLKWGTNKQDERRAFSDIFY
jgi:hypothetical protein